MTEYRAKAELLAKVQMEAGSAPSELEAARNAHEEAAGRSRLNQRRLTKAERELDSLRQQVVAGKAALDARQPAIESLPATDRADRKNGRAGQG